MAQGFQNWSLTAATNATADASCPFPEGMAPSALNDGTRAMMARLREYGNDISGSIISSGTSTAFTVTTAQNFTTLASMNGQIVAFTPHATSGTPATLNVDGLGAKPLRTSTGVEIPTGILVAGTPYVCLYNNSDGAFYLRDFYPIPYAVPIGMLAPYVGTTAPNSNFVLPFGQAVSRTTYATLFALTASQFGDGNGSTTFNLPDCRGRAVFGVTNMGGSDNGLITVAGGNFDGSIRTSGGAQNHTLSAAEMPAHSHTATVTDAGHSHTMSTAIYKDGVSSGIALGDVVITANAAGNPVTVASATTGITVANANTGSGGAHSIMPPAITLPYILRVI